MFFFVLLVRFFSPRNRLSRESKSKAFFKFKFAETHVNVSKQIFTFTSNQNTNEWESHARKLPAVSFKELATERLYAQQIYVCDGPKNVGANKFRPTAAVDV